MACVAENVKQSSFPPTFLSSPVKHQRVGAVVCVCGVGGAVRENTKHSLDFLLTAGKFKKGTSTPGLHVACQEKKMEKENQAPFSFG